MNKSEDTICPLGPWGVKPALIYVSDWNEDQFLYNNNEFKILMPVSHVKLSSVFLFYI